MEQLRLIALVVLLIFSTPTLAQTPRYIGISGGIVNNVLVGSEIDFRKKVDNDVMRPKTGPTFSVFLKKEITARWFIKYEADYIRKGNNSNNPGYVVNAEYLSIPLKFGFQPINFLNTKKFQSSIEFGPAFNLEVGNGTANLKKAYAAATSAKSSKAGLSVLAGANFEYRLDQRRIVFLNYTFYHDLSPVLSYDAGNVTYKAANQGWMINAGLLFPLH